MLTRRPLSNAVLVGIVLFSALRVWAHRPYERMAGTFERSDGEAISIVRHYVDGIFFADPVSIKFRLPDGTEVAKTPYVFDSIVRHVPTGVEIYHFPTTWIPVASRVEFFDGYELKGITSSRRLVSPFVHFADHWIAYLVALGFAVFFEALYSAFRAMPTRGWYGPIRALGFAVVGLAMGLYVYGILVFEPVSPLVLLGCVSVYKALFRFIRRKRIALVHPKQTRPTRS